MPQLDPTWFASQIFWLAVTFAALYFLMSRLVLPPLEEVVGRRQQTISGDLDRAQRLKSEAERARLEYERLLAETRAKAQKLLDDAMQAHKQSAETQARAMEQQIEHKLKEASQKISAKKQELIAILTPTAVDLTAMIVEKLTNRAPSSDQVGRVLNELSKSKRAA
ncbi:MAG: F0F1 ATP synthase subunit B' [Pseudomonadota bacterium]|nr:F0F1 ATP synthase subunit B' [Pseudomonadota bacterium]